MASEIGEVVMHLVIDGEGMGRKKPAQRPGKSLLSYCFYNCWNCRD